MAKRLGIQPGALVRLIPSPQQKWKLPVRLFIHDLYEERFGALLGEKPVVSKPLTLEEAQEAQRRFEEELYWEDYHERNRDDDHSAVSAPHAAPSELDDIFIAPITDEDVPF